MFQIKEQVKKNPAKTPNETEVNNLPYKEFKALVVRTVIVLRERINKHNENLISSQRI